MVASFGVSFLDGGWLVVVTLATVLLEVSYERASIFTKDANRQMKHLSHVGYSRSHMERDGPFSEHARTEDAEKGLARNAAATDNCAGEPCVNSRNG